MDRAEQLRVLLVERHQPPEEEFETRQCRPVRAPDPLQHLPLEAPRALIEQRLAEQPLVRVAAVERPLPHPRLARDLVHADRLDPARREEPRGGREDLPPVLRRVPPLPARCDHLRAGRVRRDDRQPPRRAPPPVAGPWRHPRIPPFSPSLTSGRTSAIMRQVDHSPRRIIVAGSRWGSRGNLACPTRARATRPRRRPRTTERSSHVLRRNPHRHLHLGHRRHGTRTPNSRSST